MGILRAGAETLSKQKHYDYGVRGLKTILLIAGAIKRANPTEEEENIIFQAYHYFFSMLVPSDRPVFEKLMKAYFPSFNP